MLVVAFIIVRNEVYTVPVNNGRDFFVWSDITTENFDIREVATSSIAASGGADSVPPRLIESNSWSLQIIYSCKDCDNILTLENLRLIEKVEMEVLLDPKFQHFCLRESFTNPRCSVERSFVSFPSIIKGVMESYSMESMS